jgi:hypothetical protein
MFALRAGRGDGGILTRQPGGGECSQAGRETKKLSILAGALAMLLTAGAAQAATIPPAQLPAGIKADIKKRFPKATIVSAFTEGYDHVEVKLKGPGGPEVTKTKPHLRRVAGGVLCGGAGNRTPVPWHFRVGFYVRSLSFEFRPWFARQAGDQGLTGVMPCGFSRAPPPVPAPASLTW